MSNGRVRPIMPEAEGYSGTVTLVESHSVACREARAPPPLRLSLFPALPSLCLSNGTSPAARASALPVSAAEFRQFAGLCCVRVWCVCSFPPTPIDAIQTEGRIILEGLASCNQYMGMEQFRNKRFTFRM